MSLFSVPGKTMLITGAVFTLPPGKRSPRTLHSRRTLISSCVERLPHGREGDCRTGSSPSVEFQITSGPFVRASGLGLLLDLEQRP